MSFDFDDMLNNKSNASACEVVDKRQSDILSNNEHEIESLPSIISFSDRQDSIKTGIGYKKHRIDILPFFKDGHTSCKRQIYLKQQIEKEKRNNKPQ